MNLVIPGEPVPKERPRINRKTGNVYTPKRSQQYEEMVAWYARASATVYEAGKPLKVVCDFFCLPCPEAQIPDLDNLVKAVLDGLQKSGAIPNDRMVVDLEAHRWMDEQNPRAEVSVAYA